MRAEVEGRPKGDSVRHTSLRSFGRDTVRCSWIKRGDRRHLSHRTLILQYLRQPMSQYVKTTKPSGHGKSSRSDCSPKIPRCKGVTFCAADDDSAARPDYELHRGYTEYDRSTGGPDGIGDRRT
jgi:hypothetical protein